MTRTSKYKVFMILRADDVLNLLRFSIVQPTDTLLSHVAMSNERYIGSGIMMLNSAIGAKIYIYSLSLLVLYLTAAISYFYAHTSSV